MVFLSSSLIQAFLVETFLFLNFESEKVFFAFVLEFYEWLKYYSTKKNIALK